MRVFRERFPKSILRPRTGQSPATGIIRFQCIVGMSCGKGQCQRRTWLLKVDSVNLSKSGSFPIMVGVESKNPSTCSLGVSGFVYPKNAKLVGYRLGWVTVNDANPVNAIDVTPPWLNFSPWGVCVSGNYCYVAAGVNGLHIFDISNPAKPVWVNQVAMPDMRGV